ncbi:energy-coupling factor transporter transmembrane component T [Miniphocaeibacter halophilus]|uniref:Energy-coupling factor transporter transmembrane protein EcfT n=1 Tax=Miniphocaeibacter halophilus TaxID=2931922 RepID=A0AC61MSD9_9FIRM|nr:energy-coupling factor transporter transmembrane component T [Miniphocaeibacter halophilus]QQK08457.1 energy-coupling factor transporter transmembrane protein EcfT [Miniphocaeibacter halophilus]
MESIRAENPIYPLLTLLSSIMVFVFGMVIAKSKLIVLFCISLIILYGIFSYGKTTFKLLLIFIPLSFIPALLSIPAGGLENAFQIYFRFICFVLAAIPSLGLPPINLVRNFNNLKIPRGISLGILITIKFIPIMIKEIKQVWNAMKTRGINVNIFNFKVIYRAFIIPIMMRILNISDLLSISLETRAFVLEDKEITNYKDIKFTKRDLTYFIILIGIILTISYLYIRGSR